MNCRNLLFVWLWKSHVLEIQINIYLFLIDEVQLTDDPWVLFPLSYSVQLHLILKLYCADDLEIIPFFYLKINFFYILWLWNQHGQYITPAREVDCNQEILFSFFHLGHQHPHLVAQRALIFSYEEINSLIH